jgi:signal transduction histidine kinase
MDGAEFLAAVRTISPDSIRGMLTARWSRKAPPGRSRHTGQGLALAHTAIVRRHGGEIWFESEVEKGTTFYIELPLVQAAKA